jgi:hypothetical protein
MTIEALSDREMQLATQVAELKRELAALRSHLTATLEALACASQALKRYEQHNAGSRTCSSNRVSASLPQN